MHVESIGVDGVGGVRTENRPPLDNCRLSQRQVTTWNVKNVGPPQGPVLAGLFHVIHSNVLPDCHQEGESVVYVDDDTDSVHIGDPEQLVDKLQREVNNTVSW
jgi:hypothetical protein